MNAILDTIADALARGDRVELRGFGAFSVKRRDARTARNPRRPLAFNPLGVVSRKREGADLVAGFVLDADLPLAVAPELAAEVSQHRDTRGEWTGGFGSRAYCSRWRQESQPHTLAPSHRGLPGPDTSGTVSGDDMRLARDASSPPPRREWAGPVRYLRARGSSPSRAAGVSARGRIAAPGALPTASRPLTGRDSRRIVWEAVAASGLDFLSTSAARTGRRRRHRHGRVRHRHRSR